MQLDRPVVDPKTFAVGVSWPLQKALDHIFRQAVFHEAWDSSIPLTLIIRGDAFPVARTNWSQISFTWANWGERARNLSHTFIISVVYSGVKNATQLQNLWKKNVQVF